MGDIYLHDADSASLQRNSESARPGPEVKDWTVPAQLVNQSVKEFLKQRGRKAGAFVELF